MACPVPIQEINYNVEDEYGDFIRSLRDVLRDHGEREVVGNNSHLLPRQTYGKAPARWIHINLTAMGGQRTTLAVRDDNLYLIGFKNSKDQWFEFGFEMQSARMVDPKSTFLECGVSYSSMVRKPQNLVYLRLGRSFMRDAVCLLSGYTQAPCAKPSGKIKKHLAGLIVMICEAARMNPHYTRVRDGWRQQRGSKIGNCQVNYILNWGDMSEALLRWKKNQYPDSYEFPDHLMDIGITCPARALDIVYLLLNRRIIRDSVLRRQPYRRVPGDHDRREGPPPNKRRRSEQQPEQGHGRDPQQQQQPERGRHSHGGSYSQLQDTAVQPGEAKDLEAHGRPLVEVFAIHADFNFVGTIAIFDGMRGQIIYKNDSIEDSPQLDDGTLLLTGPYKAVSAYGSFTIEVKIKEGESVDAGELNWDCYDEKNEYDKPITDTIRTTSGREVKLTYAVLSYAVEANVKLHVLLPEALAETRFYGRVVVHRKAIDDSDHLPSSIIFDPKNKGEQLINYGGSGSMALLPLERSVLAMPPDWQLVMEVTLYNEPRSNQGVNPFFQCQDLKLTLIDHPSETRKVGGVEVEVKISSPDLYRPARPSGRNTTTAPTCADYVCPKTRFN